jgi:hypothetical protein
MVPISSSIGVLRRFGAGEAEIASKISAASLLSGPLRSVLGFLLPTFDDLDLLTGAGVLKIGGCSGPGTIVLPVVGVIG